MSADDSGGHRNAGRRGPSAVAASLLAVMLLGGYVAAAPASAEALPAEFAVNAVILVLVYWFPAMRITAPGDVLTAWKTLVPWILAWTLVWDLATSGIVGERALLQEWWIVYPAGMLALIALFLLHGLVVKRAGAARDDE